MEKSEERRHMADQTTEDKKQAAIATLQTLPPDVAEAKKDIATVALQTLAPNTPEANKAKKDIATAALQTLPPDAAEARKDIATAAMRDLSAADQTAVLRQVQGPSQEVANRIWQWIVAAFAIAFVGGTGALVVGVFVDAAQIQILVTVFTTVAGILAGFISGRASSAETASRGPS
jgi:ribosomal protein L29